MVYNKSFFIDNINSYSKLELQSIICIKDFIVNYYQKLGLDFDYEMRKIINTDYDCPKFFPDRICLTTKSYTYWSQVIYQLSHELTHCFIYCHNKNADIKWLEETICEAMSLYFLKLFYNYWSDTFIGKYNPTYKDSLKEYLDDILEEKGNDRLSNAKSLKELESINSTSEEKRIDRRNEKIRLFNLIKEEDIKGLIYYTDYVIKDSILVDTDRYIGDYKDNLSVKYICSIQDRIVNLREV